MPYATKYQLQFLSRKNKTFRVDLQLKDYTDGTITQLTGAPDPFLLNYESGDDSIINPIRASECTINFYNDGATPLTEFYSEDDEAWKIIITNIDTNQILWAGFIVQDDCREIFQDPPHVIQLKGTDNLALLKDVPFNEAWNDVLADKIVLQDTSSITVDPGSVVPPVPIIYIALPGSDYDTTHMDFIEINGIPYTIEVAQWIAPNLAIRVTAPYPPTGTYTATWIITSSEALNSIIDKFSLFDYIKAALIKTGLELTLNTYGNIYENSMPDRNDSPGNDMLRQTLLFSGMFLNDDGTWANTYDVVEKVLKPLNFTLFQSLGVWQLVRWPELRLFSNAIPGISYDQNWDVYTPVSLPGVATIAHGTDMELINADAERSILRPYKYVKWTFNYEQPKELIYNSSLKVLGDVDHGSGSTIYYKIPTAWTLINTTDVGATGIQIAVDTDPTTGRENFRSIHLPKNGDVYRWLRFNPIDVTKDSHFDYSFTFTYTSAFVLTATFHVRIFLITSGGTFYSLMGKINADGSIPQYLQWSGLNNLPIPDDVSHLTLEITIPSGNDEPEFTFDLKNFLPPNNDILPGVPVDGILLIDMGQPKDSNSNPGTFWAKDIKIEFENIVTRGQVQAGQTHKTPNTPFVTNKNNLEDEIKIDDSPRNSIAGTLFTADTTDFGPIGLQHVTRTKAWHRMGFDETRRLGEITTLEREQMQQTPRAKLEGTVDYLDSLVSILNVIQIDTLQSLNFIFGVTEFNFMEGQFKATLWEVYATEETDQPMDYKFDYIYEQT